MNAFTRHRGELAIHAAKRWGPEEREFAAAEHALGRLPARLPLGAIVAVCRLTEVRGVETCRPEPVEKLYGNYSPGRFGWLLEDIRALPEPIGCVGRQSLWTLSLNVQEAVRAQL